MRGPRGVLAARAEPRARGRVHHHAPVQASLAGRTGQADSAATATGSLKGQGRPAGVRAGAVGRGGGGQQQGHHQGHPGQGAVHLGGLRQAMQVRNDHVTKTLSIKAESWNNSSL